MQDDGRRSQSGVAALALMARLTGELSTIASPAVAAAGFSNAMMRIFVLLDTEPGLLPSAIADRLDLDRSVISRTLGKLDTLGMVTRKVDSGDRRQVRVRLSPRGRRQMDAYRESIVLVLASAAPLLDATLKSLDADTDDGEPREAPPASAVIDRLAEIGSRMVRRFVELEKPYALTDPAQRFALWLIADEVDVLDVAAMSRLLVIPSPRMETALDVIDRAGLAAPEPSGRLGLTPAGEALVAAEASVLLEHRTDLVDVLASARSIATDAGGVAPSVDRASA